MNILLLDACISTNHPSRTKILCENYMEQYRTTQDEIAHVILEDLGLMPLTAQMLEKRNKLIKEQKYDDEMFVLARQFQKADRVILAAPFWDMTFPSVVKVYIEQIMIGGITFKYEDNSSVGLCQADKLVYIMTAGGYVGEQNLGYEYIKSIADMLGIQETELYCGEGLDIWGANVDKILEDICQEMHVPNGI
ncbi:MAG: NAD(P)H-dependent oxidoreductase [Anaerostipes sp.]|nr:NAD(P)H-dependent oxidoreductase [Anaerostipes sp.]